MSIELVDTFAGITVPDTALTRDVTDFIRSAEDDLTSDAVAAVTSAHPRPDFKHRILMAFTAGMEHRPRTTYGTMNADVLAHFDPSFVRDDFVTSILDIRWPE
jgi:hypothetical protein